MNERTGVNMFLINLLPHHRPGILLLAFLACAGAMPASFPDPSRLYPGEYELYLDPAAPFRDIMQAEIRWAGEKLQLKPADLDHPFDLAPVAGQPRIFEIFDKEGTLLYYPGKPVRVEFEMKHGVVWLLIRNEEVCYRGRRIGPAAGREGRPGVLTAKEVRADLRQLRRIMEHVHPALYVFTSKSEFKKLFSRQDKRIAPRLALHDCFSLVAPLVARIGCGHAAVEPPAGYFSAPDAGLWPAKLHVEKEKAFLIESLTGGMPRGAEILAIDGIPLASIITVLKKCITSDGLLDSTLTYRLNRHFSRLYASVYGLRPEFRVRYIPGGLPPAAAVETVIPAVPAGELKKLWPEPGGRTPFDRHLKFEITPDRKAAIMTIHSFGFYDDNAGFQRWTGEAFSRIREEKIKNLILDLRGNDGGDPHCSAHLLKYLSAKPVPYFSRKYGEHYATLAEPRQPAEYPFAGTLWTLVDGGCLSSTTHLCALLKYHRIGCFAGEETAGNYTCNDRSKTFVLSRSGIRVTLARGTYAVAVSGMPRERGIIPDIPVEPRLADLLGGTDPVLSRVLTLLDEKPE